MEKVKGFKTIGFNLLMLVASVTGAQIDPAFMTEWIEAIAAVWAGGNAVLRAVTSSPIFQKW
jgi:hypothetical protein